MTVTVSTSQAPESLPTPARQDRLPVRALVGLFLAGFVSILTGCLPAGLLPKMSETLGTSVSLTGQTVTLYALATALGAIPLARATATWRRKHVLQLALAVVAVTNALTALSGDYTLTMVLRFVTDLLSSVGMAARTGRVLFTFGVTSVLGVLGVGAHIDRHLRGLTVGSTVLFGAGVLVLGAPSGAPVLVYAAVAGWGFAFGGSPSLFVGAAIDATRDAADVAQSITITVFSASIAAGSLLGGLLLAGPGTASLTWAALALLVAAAATVIGGRRHAFPPNG
ncbi:MFS transporter [Streptomyces sp. NPDC050560]|uniref:MFS transporter n=1 Tax=Streptomyces sp. NPDC050560 TaxID=3365630 RepID=UPI003792B337